MAGQLPDSSAGETLDESYPRRQAFGRHDRQTDNSLFSKRLLAHALPGIEVNNPELKEMEPDRYVLDETYHHPKSFYTNDKDQLVFERITSLARVQILLPPGYIPVDMSHPMDVTALEDRILLRLTDMGYTQLKITMEPATL